MRAEWRRARDVGALAGPRWTSGRPPPEQVGWEQVRLLTGGDSGEPVGFGKEGVAIVSVSVRSTGSPIDR
jgi:hypothetical protein